MADRMSTTYSNPLGQRYALLEFRHAFGSSGPAREVRCGVTYLGDTSIALLEVGPWES